MSRRYVCIDEGDSNSYFTKGKIYKLRRGLSLSQMGAFIDDEGLTNGFFGSNHIHFRKVEKKKYKVFCDGELIFNGKL